MPFDVCPAQPDLGCRTPTAPRAGLLTLRHGRSSAANLLRWRSQFGSATALGDFGFPLATTDYRLCVYNPGGLVLDLAVPAGGTCNGRPCWTLGNHTFRYRNGTGAGSAGLDVILRAGSNKKATVTFSARGPSLTVPALPFALPGTVQLRADNGICWSTSHASAGIDTARDLRSRSD